MSFNQETCADFCRMMEEDSLTSEEEAALQAHIAQCPSCKEEAELRALMKASAYAPPADLKALVMRRIRQEKAKAARHRSLKRITAAVCAAVILVPALVILAPRLRGGFDSVADFGGIYGAAGLPETCADEGFDVKKDADAVLNGAQEDAAEDKVTSAAPMYTAPTKDTVCDGVGDAVDLSLEAAPGNSGTGVSCAPTDPVKESETESTFEEPAFYEKLRTLVGVEAFDEWLAQYDGAPDYAEAAAYEYFGLAP